jgi:hypothetical protein
MTKAGNGTAAGLAVVQGWLASTPKSSQMEVFGGPCVVRPQKKVFETTVGIVQNIVMKREGVKEFLRRE